MSGGFGLGLLPSDVRQARAIVGGEIVVDPGWKALLVASWLKGDDTNRARLERSFPDLPASVAGVAAAGLR